MKVYLLHDHQINDELYFGIVDFLQRKPGPYQFIPDLERSEIEIEDEIKIGQESDEDFHFQSRMMKNEYSIMKEVQKLSWNDLLKVCQKFRKKNKLNEDDIVILLTDYGNHINWFGGFDAGANKNYFIHTGSWQHYVNTDPRYPVTYQIASLLLKIAMYNSNEEMAENYHKRPIGCIMDFCKDKRDVSLKMRTADICNDCQQIIQSRNVPLLRTRFTIEVMDSIRTQLLYLQRFSILKQSLPLLIKGKLQQLYIPDLGMLHIPLSPMERSVYLLFLNHPEGIRLVDIDQHKLELGTYLHSLSRHGERKVIECGLNELCNFQSNSLSEKISKIRRKFIEALSSEMADPYCIKGVNGEIKGIELDRELVQREE